MQILKKTSSRTYFFNHARQDPKESGHIKEEHSKVMQLIKGAYRESTVPKPCPQKSWPKGPSKSHESGLVIFFPFKFKLPMFCLELTFGVGFAEFCSFERDC